MNNRPEMQAAIDLCTDLYKNLSPLGIFPALTGGTLYKDGPRKDIDIVLYRKDCGDKLELKDVYDELVRSGLFIVSNYGRVAKGWSLRYGTDVDIIFPEADGSYEEWQEREETPLPTPRVHPFGLPR